MTQATVTIGEKMLGYAATKEIYISEMQIWCNTREENVKLIWSCRLIK